MAVLVVKDKINLDVVTSPILDFCDVSFFVFLASISRCFFRDVV
jgi:hypothetical protein